MWCESPPIRSRGSLALHSRKQYRRRMGRSRIQATTRRRGVSAGFAVAALLMLFASGNSSALTGDGTVGNPYRNANVGPYYWSQTGQVNSMYQDMLASSITTNLGTFFSFNPRFSLTSGFYAGLQNQGQLSNGTTVSRSALTGLFATTFTNFKNLQPTICNSAADFGNPGDSCAIEYSWTPGVQYRINFDAIPTTSGGWCPLSTLNPNGTASYCMVYVATVAQTGNPSAKTQIAAWSIDTRSYGVPSYAVSFLEVFSGGVPCNAGSPAGYFVVPFKVFGANAYGTSSISGSDSSPGCPAPKWWFDWVVQRITY